MSYMKTVLRFPLQPNVEQRARLLALQAIFAQVCNALAPTVRDTRCWNRVALHHMTYKNLRERFPELGSQMVCNAIYAVSRACRMVYQHPGSPFCIARGDVRPLPLLQFADTAPVYFDWHTLSLKAGKLSLFTLNGRMRFQLVLRSEDEIAFSTLKVTEIMLSRQAQDEFELTFSFASAEVEPAPAQHAKLEHDTVQPTVSHPSNLPNYLEVLEAA